MCWGLYGSTMGNEIRERKARVTAYKENEKGIVHHEHHAEDSLEITDRTENIIKI